jgi:hypothetical protein
MNKIIWSCYLKTCVHLNNYTAHKVEDIEMHGLALKQGI